ncbi:MAG: GPR endopeptidase [Lachnospiraceae bacterium]|nr:GPR endopeptidase [Lachnospiraceae bacterium]
MEGEIRTDLALEMQERFTEDDVEVSGVALTEDFCEDGKMRVTKVEILDEHGAQVMKKPVGTYITIEAAKLFSGEEKERRKVSEEVGRQLGLLCADKKICQVLVTGLGNREVTPDSLGPLVTDQLFVTRHLLREYGEGFLNRQLEKEEDGTEVSLSAVAPGVMGQTGMEAVEIIQGLVKKIGPDLVLVVDALAARSVERLNTTVQLTDTGICPGAGIGNNRKSLNKESIGCPVIAIGVPTVVDAVTIVRDSMEGLLQEQGFEKKEIGLFLRGVEDMRKMNTMFVTPKSIDEEIHQMSRTISEAINYCFFGI